MDKQFMPTGMTPELFIGQVMGDLTIKGWDEPQVNVQADPEQLALEKKDNIFHISCQEDCVIRVPHTATIHIGSVHGDAHFKYLTDDLDIGDVHGSLTLRTVGPTQIGVVHGDFSAKEVDGGVKVSTVFGNAAVREIMGDCMLDDVQGNLDLRDISGQLNARSNGNVRMRMDMPIGGAYQVHADGNLHCTFSQDVSAKLELSSDAEIIKVKLPESAQVHRQQHISLTLGEAEESMILSAGGGLYLFCDSEGHPGGQGDIGAWSEDFSQQIAHQVEAQISSQMEMMSQQLSEQMERMSSQLNRAGMNSEQVNRILEQAHLVGERETARTQEKVRRAQEKLERKLEATRRQNEARAQAAEARSHMHTRRGWGAGGPNIPPAPPTPPVPPAPAQPEQASEEERLLILRMLEQKKISLDEADRLLSALEGKE